MSARPARERAFRRMRDLTPEDWDAIAAGEYDWVMPKYDGHYAKISISPDGRWEHRSSTNRLVRAGSDDSLGGTHLVLYGEYIANTTWAKQQRAFPEGVVVLFAGGDESPFSDEAHTSLREINPGGNPAAELVCLVSERRPVVEAASLWEDYVLGGGEGLVFGSADGSKLARMKRVFTADYICVGVVEGTGKHAGRVGALKIGLYQENNIYDVGTVGTGLSDSERSAIFAEPNSYIGRVLEVAGKGKYYGTGLLRHPSFVRWRDDKHPLECRWG